MSRQLSVRLRIGLIFGLLILSFNNCSQPGDLVLTTPAAQIETPNFSSTAIEELPPPAPQYIDKEKVIDVKYTKKVDVLVIIDNSGSMAFEQENMAMRFNSFFNQLNGFDWQLAIAITDDRTALGNGAAGDGKFLEFVGLPGEFILNSSMTPAVASAAFANTIKRAANGSSNEQGIKNTYRAIERYLDSSSGENIPNNRFFRDDAAFATIVVSDADETVNNGDNLDLAKREAKLGLKNKPDELVKFVDQTWMGQKTFSFNAIIVKPGDSACRAVTTSGGNEGYGDLYDRLVKQTGGVTGSVCEDNYSNQLSIIGKKVAELVKSATLDCPPVDSDKDGKPDIVVVNNLGQQEKNFVITGLQINFTNPLPDGLNSIRYRCAK
ncbi:MAG: vWA domain-containing protein [Pseudobdellovibrionaceae bacterium]